MGSDRAFAKSRSVTDYEQFRAGRTAACYLFPPLPENIEDEVERPQRQPVVMPELAVEEIECCLMKTKPWKAAGEGRLPAIQVCPAEKENVRHLFQNSLDIGTLLRPRKITKIVPLNKANKDDYTLAKAWRPIFHLVTNTSRSTNWNGSAGSYHAPGKKNMCAATCSDIVCARRIDE